MFAFLCHKRLRGRGWVAQYRSVEEQSQFRPDSFSIRFLYVPVIDTCEVLPNSSLYCPGGVSGRDAFESKDFCCMIVGWCRGTVGASLFSGSPLGAVTACCGPPSDQSASASLLTNDRFRVPSRSRPSRRSSSSLLDSGGVSCTKTRPAKTSSSSTDWRWCDWTLTSTYPEANRRAFFRSISRIVPSDKAFRS